MPDTPPPRFVVRPLAADVQAPAGARPVGGARPGWVVERPASADAADTAAAWRDLQAELGERFQVLPLLHDDAGEPRFPTGELMVRFRAAVPDARLAALAASSGLQMIRRSAFTQNQAAFRPLAPHASWAPALIDALCAANADIEAAWLDAEARYRRGD